MGTTRSRLVDVPGLPCLVLHARRYASSMSLALDAGFPLCVIRTTRFGCLAIGACSFWVPGHWCLLGGGERVADDRRLPARHVERRPSIRVHERPYSAHHRRLLGRVEAGERVRVPLAQVDEIRRGVEKILRTRLMHRLPSLSQVIRVPRKWSKSAPES